MCLLLFPFSTSYHCSVLPDGYSSSMSLLVCSSILFLPSFRPFRIWSFSTRNTPKYGVWAFVLIDLCKVEARSSVIMHPSKLKCKWDSKYTFMTLSRAIMICACFIRTERERGGGESKGKIVKFVQLFYNFKMANQLSMLFNAPLIQLSHTNIITVYQSD